MDHYDARILHAVLGAMDVQRSPRVNLCLLIPAMVVIGGIVDHLTMMNMSLLRLLTCWL